MANRAMTEKGFGYIQGRRRLLKDLACLAATTVLARSRILAGPEPDGSIAVPAKAFLGSIGACSAVSRRGEDLARTIEAVRYLGLGWLRVGYESNIPLDDLIELHQQTGVLFSYGLMSGGSDIQRLLEAARRLAAAGALLAIEGCNEPNNWAVTYQGSKGGKDLSWLPVARLQKDLYAAVKADPVLRYYPVWNISEPGAQTDNCGLQFLTIPPTAGCLMPDGTIYADYANCHNYITHPAWPGLHDNQCWLAADPTSACRVDGLYANYGLTWRNRFKGYTESDLAMLPRVTTETGVLVAGPVTEQVHGRLLVGMYLSQFKRNWSYTAVYLLRDRTDEPGNQGFGFYRPDYSPRPAAIWLHNLTTILADRNLARPCRFQYAMMDQPETLHHMPLSKSDGTIELLLWSERFTGGHDEVTIIFGDNHSLVRLYDPSVGAQPTEQLAGIRSLNLDLSSQFSIIEIPAR